MEDPKVLKCPEHREDLGGQERLDDPKGLTGPLEDPEGLKCPENREDLAGPEFQNAINVMKLHRSFAFAIKFRVWSGRKGGRKAAMGGWSVGGFYAAKKWQVCPHRTIRLQSE